MAKQPEKSKQFKYNLNSVLKYRNIKEKEAQDEFVKSEQLFKEEKSKEEQLKDMQRQRYLELAESMGAGQTVDFQQVLMRRSHLDVVKGQVVEQEKVADEAEQKKEDKREDLVKAVKDRKILDKDKEKKQDRWKKVMKKEENKFLDEIATIGYERKRRLREEDDRS